MGILKVDRSFSLVPTLRVGTPWETLRVSSSHPQWGRPLLGIRDETLSVSTCVPTRSVGTRG
ncbi:MAG: hypothetical protein JO112_02455 [Planctomycetes bacterium]|nr:hypothetical protein [Planctomycetota bacterium]